MKATTPKLQQQKEIKKAERLALRLEIAILSSKKKTPSQISKQLNVSRPTVYLWQQRFQEKGLSGIDKDLPRSGRKPSISKEQERAVISKAKELKSNSAGRCKITTLAHATGIEYGATRRILLRNNLLQTHLERRPNDCKVNYEYNKSKTASPTSERNSPSALKQSMASPSSRPQPITQKEIARQLGFSQSTVSLALNSSQIPKRETQLKIKKTAKQYNYTPTPNATSLINLRWHKKLRTANIALLTPERVSKKEDQGFYRDIQEQIREKGYALQIIELNEQTPWNKLDRRLRQQGTQGVILGKDINQATCLKLKESIQWERVTGLTLTPEANWLHSITGNDNFDRIKQAITKTLNQGYDHSSFAFIDLSRTPSNRIQREVWTPLTLSLHVHPIHAIRNISAPKLPPLIFQHQSYKEQVTQLSAYLRQHTPESILGDQDACYPLLQEACRGLPQPTFISLRKQDKQDKQIAGLMRHQRKDEIKLIIDCIDKQIRTNEWGLPTHPIHHNHTKNLWRDGLSLSPKTKQKQVKVTGFRNQPPPHQPALETLSLQKIFNRSAQTRGQWIGKNILPLHAGKHQINKIPFQIGDTNHPSQPNCLIMQSSVARPKDKLPRKVTLPLSGYRTGVHILHTCGWAGLSSIFASYKFIYTDDTEDVIPLYSYGNEHFGPDEIKLSPPTPESSTNSKPNIGDWHAYYRIDPSKLQASTQVFKGSTTQIDTPFKDYYLFTLHWKNPHPNKQLKALQIESDKNKETTLALLAVTLES